MHYCMWVSWIVFAVAVFGVLLYCKFGRESDRVSNFRKPFSVIGLIAYAIVLLICCSCRGLKYIPVEGEVRIIEKEKLVPVVNPADSASIRAFLECDENGRVVLKCFDIEKSKNMQLQFSLDSLGYLLANAKTEKDTIYLPSKDRLVEKKTVEPYPVERQLNRWESMKMELGGWAFGILLFSVLVLCWFMLRAAKNKLP